MTLNEWEVLTGQRPDILLWETINRSYNQSNSDKHQFADDYLADKDGLATRIQRECNTAYFAQDAELKRQLAALQKELATERCTMHAQSATIQEMREQLERELDWHPSEDTGTSLVQDCYIDRINSDSNEKLSDLQAMQKLNWLFGFDMAKITIVHEVQTFDVNRHHKLRVSGTYQRDPLWDATDYNYIRFNCADLQWECIDGELHPYCD